MTSIVPWRFAQCGTIEKSIAYLGWRAHNVRPYGLYRDKTQFSAPDYILRQYRIILSADTASEVRQMLSQKRR